MSTVNQNHADQYAAYEAKRAARAARVKALKDATPHLVAGEGCVVAAKNARIELKAAFPGVKFSVTTSKFAGGNSMRVGWTDGPTSAEVNEILGKYEEGSFDGMNDLYTYESTYWADAFGSAKYVSESREFSDGFIAEIIEALAERYGRNNKPTVEDVRKGRAYASPFERGGDGWYELIYRAARKSKAGKVVAGL